MTAKQSLSFTKALLVDTFRPNPQTRQEIKKLESSLCYRAWMFHIIVTLSRVIYPILGISYWQRAFKSRLQNKDVDQDFLDDYEDIIKGVIIALIPVGMIIDVVCYWRRDFGKVIFYYELLSTFVQGFVPINHGDAGVLILLLVLNTSAIFFGTQFRWGTACCVLT